MTVRELLARIDPQDIRDLREEYFDLEGDFDQSGGEDLENGGVHQTVKCIRCDAELLSQPSEGLTLTYNQETGAVKACEDCAEVVKRRNYINDW